MNRRSVVGMAGIEVARAPRALAAIGLGSCIAVVLHDATARVGGLAHVVLPARGAGRERGGEGRYATSAVPALVNRLMQAGADQRRLVARVVGGACMFAGREGGERGGVVDLGERNLQAVREALARCSIPIVGEWAGGDFGRSVYYDPATGAVRVTSVRHGTRLL